MKNSAWEGVLPAILKDLRQHRMAIALGDTGMGKSSEIPQYLLESNLKKSVAVFVPRRVAAKRSAEYVGKGKGDQVGYSIGGESMNAKSARIIYLTTAMLGKAPKLDGWAKKCIVVVDECMKADIDTHTCFTLVKEVHRLGGMVVLMGAFVDDYIQKFFFSVDNYIGIGKFLSSVPVSAEVRGEKHAVRMTYWGDIYGDMPTQAADVVKWICSRPCSYDGSVLIFLAGFSDMGKVQEHLSWQRGLEFAQLRSSQTKEERDFAFAQVVQDSEDYSCYRIC